MAINPMKLLELKNLWNAFTRRHPKFPQFISAVQQAGISEGTVIEVQITIPDGRTFTSNLKVQQEDIEAVRVVEPAYKLVKKGDEEIEVPDGLKGRIIPFELVQQEKFQDDLKAIADLQMRVEKISGELDEIRESFSEEESEAYLDSEKENTFDKKAITAGAKAKKDEVEVETKEKLKKIVKLWEEQKNKNKQIKEAKQTLIDKTVEAIENLSDEEISLFLHKKWIDPIAYGINETLAEVLSTFENKICSLGKKYTISYKQLNEDLEKSQKELSDLISELTGDEFAILGLNEFLHKSRKE